MDPTLKLAVLLILLALVSELVNASPTKVDYGQCERIVKKWASSALDQEVEDRHKLQDLLFFLHVPRTGGRTYFHCFLRKLYPNSMECPRSYDRLRFDPSKPQCRLLATHDDYSIISKFPREKTSVVTILRNPLDRIFSTYEFSIEVAARFLVHPNLTSASQMDGRLRSRTEGVSTLDIWPWKYLVPWMREDLFARRDARAHREPNYIESDDPYNMKDTVMPLHQYINDPIAMDVVHNGATFQVAGLTNNSFLSKSHEVRHCIEKYKTLGKYVLEVGKKRLDDMLYVGLTEDHRESAAMFADVVGSQVLSQLVVAAGADAGDNRSVENKQSSLDPEPDINIDHQSGPTDQKVDEMVPTEIGEGVKENMTMGKLMGTYETCISNLRKTQAQRRTKSLKRISPANFTKEARRQVSEVTIQEILSLNSLDVELYKHAQNIFARQQQLSVQEFTAGDSLGSMLYGTTTLWKFRALAVLGVLMISLVVFVNARRRTSKVKI